MSPSSDPSFFLDRGLGSRIVAEVLRDAGWRVETMDERYGKAESQRIEDVQWISEATANGDVLLCKDLRITVNPLEAQCLYMNSAWVFGIPNGNLRGPQMAALYLRYRQEIFDMSKRASGPFVVAVSPEGLRRRRLAYPPQ